MASIKNGIRLESDMTRAARGGTELMSERLLQKVSQEALDGTQIHASRLTDEIDPNLAQVYYAHDLCNDPAAKTILSNEGWKRFKTGVFVSHWQRQAFHELYQIPYQWSVVIENAIEPMRLSQTRNDNKLKFIYTSTPHRGLNILYPVFDALTKNYDNIELNVYSSFALYGWQQRDAEFEPLFEALRQHPNINYHGTKSNEEVREAVSDSDVWVLPSTWQETSCLSLIEAMSAGLACVHSSLAALPETAKGLTWMYGYTDNQKDHINMLYQQLAMLVHMYEAGQQVKGGIFQKQLTDHVHNLNSFGRKWTKLLETVK